MPLRSWIPAGMEAWMLGRGSGHREPPPSVDRGPGWGRGQEEASKMSSPSPTPAANLWSEGWSALASAHPEALQNRVETAVP